MYKHQTDLEVNMQIKLELKILTTNKCSQNHSEIFMTYRVMNQLRLIAIIWKEKIQFKSWFII